MKSFLRYCGRKLKSGWKYAVAVSTSVVAYMLCEWKVPAVANRIDAFFGVIGSVIAAIWRWTWEPVPIWRWFIGVCALFVGLTVYSWLRALFSRLQQSTWRGYRADTFLGMKWEWDWSTTGRLRELRPFCNCDRPIHVTPHSFGLSVHSTDYVCQQHGIQHQAESDPRIVEEQVSTEIIHKIRTNTFPGHP